MPIRRTLASMIVIGYVASPAQAEDAAARGKTVVEQWCRLCHIPAGAAPDPDMAPPFEEIVGRAGRDDEFFRRFMQEDHFPMTTFRLFENEKADVVAYLLALQRRTHQR